MTDDSLEYSYLIFSKIGKMLQNLSSAAVVIGALRVKFSKQFERRSWASWPGTKLFDTLIEFLKDYYEKNNFEKSQQTT